MNQGEPPAVSSQQAAPQATVVYGIPLPPTATNGEVRLVRNVMTLSAILAIFTVANELLSHLEVTGSGGSASLLGLFISLTVPACGWFGARGRNRILLQTYSFVNWCCAFTWTLSVFFILVTTNQLHEECLQCKADYEAGKEPAQGNVNTTAPATTECLGKRSGQALDISKCDDINGGSGVIVVIVFSILLVIFYAYNGFLSTKLAQMSIFSGHRVGVVNRGVMEQRQVVVTQAGILQTATIQGSTVYAARNSYEGQPVMGRAVVVNEPTHNIRYKIEQV